jgi:hypothetical protein
MAKMPQEGAGARDRAARPSFADHDVLAAAANWLWESHADGAVSFLSPEFELFAELRGRHVTEFMYLSFDSETGRTLAALAKARQPCRDMTFSSANSAGAAV